MVFATLITIVRANTCNKSRIPKGMHLLDKRLMQALSFALMIHDNSTLCIDSIEKYSRFKMFVQLRSEVVENKRHYANDVRVHET